MPITSKVQLKQLTDRKLVLLHDLAVSFGRVHGNVRTYILTAGEAVCPAEGRRSKHPRDGVPYRQ